jgi:hypothetical protein
MRARLLSVALAGALALSACETAGPIGGPSSGGPVNFAAGSILGGSLSRGDMKALGEIFGPALAAGQTGAAQRWSGPNGAEGAITPRGYLFGNLRADPTELIPVAGAITYALPMEIEQGEQVTTKNANVRAAPAADAPILEKLEAGTGVEAVGKVVGQPFFLVAVKGRIRGYVSASLLTPAPGADLALAGGPTRKAHPCRAYDQTLSLGAQSDRWSGVACDRGQGWRPEQKAGATPVL